MYFPRSTPDPRIRLVYTMVDPFGHLQHLRTVPDANPERDARRGVAPDEAFALRYYSGVPILSPEGEVLSRPSTDKRVHIAGPYFFADRVELVDLEAVLDHPEIRRALSEDSMLIDTDQVITVNGTDIVVPYHPGADQVINR
ncbi:MAG TPA: hypothetical protein VK978_03885 [Candidatus Saccharimonadales bacterium]|nr:hypothetical protein [Candidatus Saccharimonadales bacterium]